LRHKLAFSLSLLVTWLVPIWIAIIASNVGNQFVHFTFVLLPFLFDKSLHLLEWTDLLAPFCVQHRRQCLLCIKLLILVSALLSISFLFNRINFHWIYKSSQRIILYLLINLVLSFNCVWIHFWFGKYCKCLFVNFVSDKVTLSDWQ
jgi:hypothetical protein